MKEEELKQLNKIDYEYEFKEFDLLCDKAKIYFFDDLLKQGSLNYKIYNYSFFDKKLTPIEQIFNIAYRLYLDSYKWAIHNNTTSINSFLEIPIENMLQEELISQQEIFYKDKKYIADFVIDFTRNTADGESYVYSKINNLKYVIELDGYAYHTNKKQVNYDYERENDLKELGYIVIRFTGSQIYNEPYTCIYKLVNIIINDIKKAVR